MRILEIGPVPLVIQVYPDETVYVGTGPDPVSAGDPQAFSFSLSRIGHIRTLLRDPAFDAVFVNRPASTRDAFGPRAIIRQLANRRALRRGFPVVRPFGDRILRLGAAAPIVLFDPSDAPYIAPHALWLWRKADVVFKRELPQDHWRLFMRTVHADVPTPRFRRIPAHAAIVAKVRPMSLGLSPQEQLAMPQAPLAKSVDVFFAGALEANSSLREAGMRELRALHARGFSIDIAGTRLPPQEFYRRCAKARIVWSPEGLGHDSFRHYEAAACGAVPLINRPSIIQYAPFRHGENALFYDPEPGGLTAMVEHALARNDELETMGAAARAHVLARHTLKARVDHMLAAVGAGPHATTGNGKT
ncbi:MAG: glycosyltransferase family 1 protein [Rhodobiaceae bacterium]|nr:glycosyltransferase family 1 protein [Rhodobiaceae bacterium]MCC0040746.1 glycosyltransferase family 1 protein [Rhodobiaceae bacterium]